MTAKIKTCEMTMGEPRNYYKCGKPAKGTIACRPTGEVMFVCGVHGKGKNMTPIKGTKP